MGLRGLLILLLFLFSSVRSLEYCGERRQRTAYVLGGRSSYAGFWPWAVSIRGRGGERPHLCGGILISTRAVLTAAHCLFKVAMGASSSIPFRLPRRRQDIVAVVGEYRLEAKDPTEQLMSIRRIHLHPRFNRTDPTRFTADIAVLELSRDIWKIGSTRPVCLPKPGAARLTGGRSCFVYGWGGEGDGGEATKGKLAEAVVPVVSREECQRHWGSEILESGTLCAGKVGGGLGKNPGVGACEGDSGGPLICAGMEAWAVYGLVSWGSLICMRKPSVFTDVASHAPWIRSLMKRRGLTLPRRRLSAKKRTRTSSSTRSRPISGPQSNCRASGFQTVARMRLALRPLRKLRVDSLQRCIQACCSLKGCQAVQLKMGTRRGTNNCALLDRRYCDAPKNKRLYPTREKTRWYYAGKVCTKFRW